MNLNLETLTPNALADLINTQSKGYQANVWRKHGLCRVYINQNKKTFAEIRYTDEKFERLQFGMKWAEIEAILEKDNSNVSSSLVDKLEDHIHFSLIWLRDNGKLRPGVNISEKIVEYSRKIRAGDSCSVWDVRAMTVYKWLGASQNPVISLELLERVAKDADDSYTKYLRSQDGRSDTVKALDAMYGVGGWDARDREDFEG